MFVCQYVPVYELLIIVCVRVPVCSCVRIVNYFMAIINDGGVGVQQFLYNNYIMCNLLLCTITNLFETVILLRFYEKNIIAENIGKVFDNNMQTWRE